MSVAVAISSCIDWVVCLKQNKKRHHLISNICRFLVSITDNTIQMITGITEQDLDVVLSSDMTEKKSMQLGSAIEFLIVSL